MKMIGAHRRLMRHGVIVFKGDHYLCNVAGGWSFVVSVLKNKNGDLGVYDLSGRMFGVAVLTNKDFIKQRRSSAAAAFLKALSETKTLPEKFMTDNGTGF